MDPIKMLDQQHDEVEQLFTAIDEAGSADEKESLFTQICVLLTIHTTIEERHLYPAIEANAALPLIEESYRQHQEAKQLLSQLLDLEVEDQGFDEMLQVLRAHVQHHVAEERSELFPMLPELLDEVQLDALAQEMAGLVVQAQERESRSLIEQELGHIHPTM